MDSLKFAYLIPLLPLAAFLLIVFVTRFFKGSRISSYISILLNTAAFVLSCFVFWKILNLENTGAYSGPIQFSLSWIHLHSVSGIIPLHLQIGILLDPLSVIMALMVTFVSTLIMIYSIGYMEGDPGFSTFFAYMSLFVMAMLILTLSNNFLLTFAGWELVGLCSYLLIGFWYKKPSAAKAAIKAFVVTRTGDVGFLIGMITLYWKTGTFNFVQISHLNLPALLSGWLLWGIPLLIFCGAVGKSAQFPLHVWLPDAMEGPTPVSALIHAATMVAAGVYLVARTYFLFVISPIALLTVAWIGVFTAFIAATMALVQWDIKRVLAYSTVSQLGYMMLGLGVGPIGFVAAIFLLLTHAFFKSLLFLGAGSVSHPFHEEENPFDMHHYGGLKKKMPHTYWTFLFATLAITGCPLFAGFFSKDEVIAAAFHSQILTHEALWGIALFTAFLTSAYMFRMFFLTFHGTKEPDPHVHESPYVMLLPLMILAVFSLIGGWFGIPGGLLGIPDWIANFMTPYLHLYHVPVSHSVDWFGMSLGTLVFAAGFSTAWVLYAKGLRFASILKNPIIKPFHQLFAQKWYMDDLWGFILGAFGFGLSSIASWVDTNLFDGSVRGVGMGTGWLGLKIRSIQTGFVQQYAFIIYLAVLILIIFVVSGGYLWTARFF
ncbi:MAG: NADH-quinone oxidoreductase subunit L [Firmicutes bacterium]|jgi:NADH-quinone oxidoreductase subunit L|nr:NADH-quinone oxidoreductase subunit L [Bacillota bacterium]